MKIFSTAVMVASKFYYDYSFDNFSHAKYLLISTSKMNAMELELLYKMKFRCFFSQQEFDSVFKNIELEVGCLQDPVVYSLTRDKFRKKFLSGKIFTDFRFNIESFLDEEDVWSTIRLNVNQMIARFDKCKL
jgi:hypothetical protein